MSSLTPDQAALFYQVLMTVRGVWNQYLEPFAISDLNRCFGTRMRKVGIPMNEWVSHADTFENYETLYLRSGRRMVAPKAEWRELGPEQQQMIMNRMEARIGPSSKILGRSELSPTAFQSPKMEEFDE